MASSALLLALLLLGAAPGPGDGFPKTLRPLSPRFSSGRAATVAHAAEGPGTDSPWKWVSRMWPWKGEEEAVEEAPKAPAVLPREERFLRDVKWVLVLFSGTARRCMAKTGDVPPEIVQALLDQNQLLYLFRDVYNDASSCVQATQQTFVSAALWPVFFAQRRGGRTYEAARAALFEAYAMAVIVAEGASRRLLAGQSQARRRRRIRVLGSSERIRDSRDSLGSSPPPLKDDSRAPKAPLVDVLVTADAIASTVKPPKGAKESAPLRRLGAKRRVQAAFDVFDADHDGSITVAEMRRVLKNVLKRRVSRAEAAAVVEIADADGDGSINYREFADAMDSTALLNPDRIIYGESAEKPNGPGLYNSLLLKDNFEYQVRGIKSRVADWVDELGKKVDAVLKQSTLPEAPLLATILRWRQFQQIRRKRVNDSIRVIEAEMGPGLDVWRELQSFPDPLLAAMQARATSAAPGSSLIDGAAAGAMASASALAEESIAKSQRGLRGVRFGARRRIKRPIARRLAPLINPVAPVAARQTLEPVAPVAGGYGITNDGTAMDSGYRRFVSICAHSSPSTIRSFQRATDRWRDGHISTRAYVRATESLFGSVATPRLLRPIAYNVPERSKGEHLTEVLAKAAAATKGDVVAPPPVEEDQRALSPAIVVGPDAVALSNPPLQSTSAEAAPPARRQFWRLWRQSWSKMKVRRVKASHDEAIAVRSLAVKPEDAPAMAETERVADAPASTSSTFMGPRKLPRDELFRQSQERAERAVAAVSRSAVVGFLLNRPLLGGELETLQIKIRVYLMGGLTARNLYDSVSVLVGCLTSAGIGAPDERVMRTGGVFFARREKERAVDAILTAAMTQLPKEKQRRLKLVMEGVRQQPRDKEDREQTTPMSTAQVALEMAEAVGGSAGRRRR